MTDNLTIPASGTGTATPVVATDDVAGVHYQRVKLVSGTLEATDAIPGDATNGLDVDVTRVTGTVTVDSELPAAAVLADNAANPTVPAVGAFGMVWDGATWDRAPGNSADGALVNLGANNDVSLNAGTNNIGDVDILTIAAGDNNIGNVDIVTLPNVTIGTMANLTESLADDAAFIPATSRVLPVGFTFDDTLPDSVNEGDIGAARMSANRNLYTTLRDAAGNERGQNVDANGNANVIAAANSGVDIGDVTINNAAGASAVPVQDGGNTLTVDNGGTFVTQIDGAALTALQLIDNLVTTEDTASANGDSGLVAFARRTATPANTSGADLDYEALQISAGRLWASATIDAAIPAGANNIGDVDVVTLPGVAGDVAHDGADSGNPVKVGAKAIAHGANPTAVAASDRTDLYANRAGIQFVIGGHPNVVTLEAAYTAAQTDVAIITIAGGLKIIVTQIQALCDNANTVDVGMRVGFGATTTPTTTGVVLTHPGIAPGSGVSRGDGSGILGAGADGEDLRITSEVPSSGSLRILVSYFTVES